MKNKILFLCAVAFVIVGCTVARVTPADPIKGTPATTNFVVDPKLTQGLATAGAVNTATAAVNPFSPVIDIGLTGIAAIAAYFAKRKNDQATQSALLTRTVIQGVEASGSAEAKAAIEKHATNVGVQGALSDLVYTVTK